MNNPLINTEAHGKIKARVGDKCLRDDFKKVIVSECSLTGLLWDQDKEPVDERCTLLHRRFEVGDPVEAEQTVAGGWLDIDPANNQGMCDIMNANQDVYRHKDPAWHNHSQWEG